MQAIWRFAKLLVERVVRKELVFVFNGNDTPNDLDESIHFEVFSKSFNKIGFDEIFDRDTFALAKNRIDNGEVLVCLFCDGTIASYGWGREQSSLHFSYVSNGINLNKNIFYIYDCYTYEKFRGKGFYSFVLTKLCEVSRNSDVYVACRSHNVSSVKGILKAGFRIYKKFVLVDLYLFKIKFILSPRNGKL